MSKIISYFTYFRIRRPFRDFKMLEEYTVCPLGCGNRQVCQIGMMGDFKYNRKRCSYCFVAIPLPKYIVKHLHIKRPKQISCNQQVLDLTS